MSQSKALTLTATWFPASSVLRETLVIVGATLACALGAQITIPWQPVPFTLQTLTLMAASLALGARRAAIAQVAYLALGVLGAPVFAGWSGGIAKLIGPTGGYLVAFVLSSLWMGWLADRGWSQTVMRAFWASFSGSILILVIGTAWLSRFFGWEMAWTAGFAPFLLVETLKAVAVSLGLPLVWRLSNSNR